MANRSIYSQSSDIHLFLAVYPPGQFLIPCTTVQFLTDLVRHSLLPSFPGITTVGDNYIPTTVQSTIYDGILTYHQCLSAFQLLIDVCRLQSTEVYTIGKDVILSLEYIPDGMCTFPLCDTHLPPMSIYLSVANLCMQSSVRLLFRGVYLVGNGRAFDGLLLYHECPSTIQLLTDLS